MSSIRGIGDVYAFRRLLWLLVGTVIVPTVLLSLFGVMAIRNQRAALLQRLDEERAERLEIGARALLAELADLESAVAARARTCTDPPECALQVDGDAGRWVWRTEEAIPPELQALGVTSDVGRAGEVVWVSPVDGSAPVAVVAHDPLRFAWRLDPAALERSLRARVRDRLPASTALVLEVPPPAGTSLEDVIARLSEPTRAALSLQRPLSGFRLRIEEDDPTRALLRRDAWLYPAMLVFLVALVLGGTVVTLGSASREIRLSRLQTDFVSSVSHELRTPLTSIRLFVETLQSGRLQDPEKVQECLDLLALESDRLSRMIERVLDWARMEAGRRVYDFEPVPPTELATASLRALRSQNLLSDEAIEVRIPEDLPPLLVDRDAIVEALLNLLQNALKYTPPPRRIVLTAARAGEGVALSVEDNGPGIPKRDRKRIFEKFYQVDSRLSTPTQGRVDRGSGLGLSIVRAVARAHGGRVDLVSEVGAGSRFTLWLPLAATSR